MLQFTGRIAFGMDIGNFLQLERSFQGDGIIEPAADKEKIPAVVILLDQFFICSCSPGSSVSIIPAIPIRAWPSSRKLLPGHRPPRLCQIQGQQEQGGQLAGKGLG